MWLFAHLRVKCLHKCGCLHICGFLHISRFHTPTSFLFLFFGWKMGSHLICYEHSFSVIQGRGSPSFQLSVQAGPQWHMKGNQSHGCCIKQNGWIKLKYAHFEFCFVSKIKNFRMLVLHTDWLRVNSSLQCEHNYMYQFISFLYWQVLKTFSMTSGLPLHSLQWTNTNTKNPATNNFGESSQGKNLIVKCWKSKNHLK